jgi:hypothetical protein
MALKELLEEQIEIPREDVERFWMAEYEHLVN